MSEISNTDPGGRLAHSVTNDRDKSKHKTDYLPYS